MLDWANLALCKSYDSSQVLLFGSSFASAVVITLGTSSQVVTYTGSGALPSGAGTGRLQWGYARLTEKRRRAPCPEPIPAGKRPVIVSSSIWTYPGNGASPLSGVGRAPGSNLINFVQDGNSFFIFTLTPNDGGAP